MFKVLLASSGASEPILEWIELAALAIEVLAVAIIAWLSSAQRYSISTGLSSAIPHATSTGSTRLTWERR